MEIDCLEYSLVCIHWKWWLGATYDCNKMIVLSNELSLLFSESPPTGNVFDPNQTTFLTEKFSWERNLFFLIFNGEMS